MAIALFILLSDQIPLFFLNSALHKTGRISFLDSSTYPYQIFFGLDHLPVSLFFGNFKFLYFLLPSPSNAYSLPSLNLNLCRDKALF